MQPTIVEGFISNQVAEDLNSFLRPLVTTNPHGILSKQLYGKSEKELDHSIYKIDKEIYLFLNKLIKNVQNKIDVPKDRISINRVLYQVLREGESLGYHTDAYGGVDGYGIIGYSALLYLTNNYQGGEILFYDDNESIAYKPNVGTLFYFKGDENYPHSVNNIISGERTNIILFFDVKNK